MVEFAGDFEPLGDEPLEEAGAEPATEEAKADPKEPRADTPKAAESPKATEGAEAAQAAAGEEGQAAAKPVPKAQIRVTLTDHKKRSRECAGRASLDTSVWDFGVSVDMDHLTTLHGYLFSYGGQTWNSNQHPALTLAEAGVKDGDMVSFAGDFEPVAACHRIRSPCPELPTPLRVGIPIMLKGMLPVCSSYGELSRL